jgi:hypothetical protein
MARSSRKPNRLNSPNPAVVPTEVTLGASDANVNEEALAKAPEQNPNPKDLSSGHPLPVAPRVSKTTPQPIVTALDRIAETPSAEINKTGETVIRLEEEISSSKRNARHPVFQEKPTEERPDPATLGEGDDWGVEKNQSLRVIIWLGLGMVGMVILGFMLLPMINRNETLHETKSAPTEINGPDTAEKDAAAVNFFVNRQADAERIFHIYSTAGLWQDLQPWVRESMETPQTVSKKWQPLGLPQDWKSPTKPQWSVVQVGHEIWGSLIGTFPDYGNYSAYFIEADGHLMLDWKATSGYSSATFSQLAKNTGDSSEIRGYIVASQFYSASWPESEYQSFQLLDPEKTTLIWCYARRASSECSTISQLLKKDPVAGDPIGDQKITLQLERGPNETAPNQWQIARLLSLDWITPSRGAKP